jgi:CheY-like chemotaxis protein
MRSWNLGSTKSVGIFRLYRVEDGEEALDFLRHSGPYQNAPRPNFVLLNLNLPQMSGFDVLQAMKDDPAIGGIPAVVFSSSRLDEDKAKCLALGAREFLTKPGGLSEFLHTLRYVCTLV